MWMKSNWPSEKVQGSVQSSTWKRRFGGTQWGWMGEMSVAITWALGFSSAKSMAWEGIWLASLTFLFWCFILFYFLLSSFLFLFSSSFLFFSFPSPLSL